MTDSNAPPWPFPSVERDHPPQDGSVSLMITKRQRIALRALGLSDEAIGVLTPSDAHALLRDRPSSPDI